LKAEEKIMKEILIKALNIFGLAWWVKISTDNPRCTYYFGPFLNEAEAKDSQAGYVEDLEGERAQGIKVSIERCKPQELTISEDIIESKVAFWTKKLSSQML
jgi:hypothetical protein